MLNYPSLTACWVLLAPPSVPYVLLDLVCGFDGEDWLEADVMGIGKCGVRNPEAGRTQGCGEGDAIVRSWPLVRAWPMQTLNLLPWWAILPVNLPSLETFEFGNCFWPTCVYASQNHFSFSNPASGPEHLAYPGQLKPLSGNLPTGFFRRAG